MNNENGFTLIEMMIVLVIISILLLIALPSMTKNNEVVKNLGCEATVDLVQGQVGAYQAENGTMPTIDELKNGYVDTVTCPGGENLVIDENGKVSVESETP